MVALTLGYDFLSKSSLEHCVSYGNFSFACITKAVDIVYSLQVEGCE